MKKNENLVFSGHSYLIHNNASNAKISGSKYSIKTKNYSFNSILLKNPIVTPSFMLKRDVKVRFYVYKGGFEDHYFLMQISKIYGPITKLKIPLVFTHKNSFGESGLSSRMWFMQRGYFIIYRKLLIDNHINVVTYCFLIVYSIIKYIRRLVIYSFIKLGQIIAPK